MATIEGNDQPGDRDKLTCEEAGTRSAKRQLASLSV